MKKVGKMFSFALILVVTSVYAGPSFTLEYITPNGQELKLDKNEIFFGSSQSNPCSDLKLVDTWSDNVYIDEPGAHTASAEEFAKGASSLGSLYGYSSPTCMRMDSYVNGKKYSTGNIRFTWYQGQVISVDPSHVIVDFTV